MSSIAQIKLLNFRNYREEKISFCEGVNVINGHNGAGKTNLLEAISLLTPGKGLRGADLSEMQISGANSWAIISEVSNYKIATGLEPNSKGRIVKIDDEKQRGTSILAEYVACIWLTPQMDGIFIEGSSERRRFFDRIIYNFDPEHAARVAVYENAMRERLRLLKNNSNDSTWLKVLEKRMAEYGIAVAAARNEVMGYLQTMLDQPSTNFPRPIIAINGKYENLLADNSALTVEGIFTNDLANSRHEDAQNGRTYCGVHKTDFCVTNFNKNIAANLCSTGEQKALLLSIVLGLAKLLRLRKNKTPIVLLDEVIAHLDESRRQELFTEICNLQCQTFMTGTEKNLFNFPANKASFLQINNASINALQPIEI